MKSKLLSFSVAVVSAALMTFPHIASAQGVLTVSSAAWNALNDAEKKTIQARFIVQALPKEAFGVIVDNQGVNRSTPGTNSGMALGEAVASATYIDKSFSHGDYSAREHLGVMLLGALVGSAMDSRPHQKYQLKYTIRHVDGNLTTRDVTSSEPFRHPVGICVLLPTLIIAPQQSICTETAESLRVRYLNPEPSQPLNPTLTRIQAQPQSERKSASPPTLTHVTCRVTNLAPVRTTAQKCSAINGEIVHDQ